MTKNKFNAPPSEVYIEFKIMMQSLASTASELQPFDFESLRQKILAYHQETGAFNRAFYSVIDMQTGDFSWQHGICESLGMPPGYLGLVDFLERLQPDYLSMFRFWAVTINEAAYALELGDTMHDFVYHISLPLRRNDGSHHWYTQHSFALQSDIAGHYVTHFNFYDYNGPWFAHNRPPFIPFITNHQKPAPKIEQKMHSIATPRIRAFFTHTEQVLIEWYIMGEPPENKLRMQPHTLHEHNHNILKKASAVLLTDFKTAKEAALLLKEAGLWSIQNQNTPT